MGMLATYLFILLYYSSRFGSPHELMLNPHQWIYVPKRQVCSRDCPLSLQVPFQKNVNSFV